MNLPFLKKKSPISSPAKHDYFLAIEVSDTVVSCACWAVIDTKPQVLSIGKSTVWDTRTVESLITACDTSISDATNHLDPSGGIQPEKIVLGVPPHWIENEKIIPEKGHLLKSMTHKLSLHAMGFVVTPEAVVRYLQITEGVPPTAILLGFSTTDVNVALVRLGKTEGVETVVRSDSPAADIAEGLSRLKDVEILPSRMLLYGTDTNLESVKQQLLAHPWQASHAHLKFLHFPKVEQLTTNFSLHALAIASGSEMTGQLPLTDPAPQAVEPHPAIESEDQPASTMPHIPEMDPEMLAEAATPASVSPQALGFIVEEAEPIHASSPSRSRIPKLPRPSLPKLALPRAGGLVAIVAGVLVIGGLLTAGYWYLPSATVNIAVQAKTISQGFDVTTSTDASSADAQNHVIPALRLEAVVSEEKTAPASGSKLVGDKATGKIKLISGLAQPKIVPAGTIVVAPNGLKFALDSEVKVASASGSPLDINEFKPGEAVAAVTAAQIGVDSNLTAGNQFKVDNFGSSVMIAKNEEAFSGGSSRQAKVVSKDDIAKLRTELLTMLKEKSKSELSAKVTDGQVLLPDTIDTKTVSENLNHKVDEVADSVTLKLSVRSSGLAYATSDVTSLASEAVLKELPQKYAPSSSLQPVIALKSQDANGSVLGVSIEATALPQINTDDVAQQIVGKSVEDASTYISSLPGVSGVDIQFKPDLPKFLKILPHRPTKITVEVKTN